MLCQVCATIVAHVARSVSMQCNTFRNRLHCCSISILLQHEPVIAAIGSWRWRRQRRTRWPAFLAVISSLRCRNPTPTHIVSSTGSSRVEVATAHKVAGMIGRHDHQSAAKRSPVLMQRSSLRQAADGRGGDGAQGGGHVWAARPDAPLHGQDHSAGR